MALTHQEAEQVPYCINLTVEAYEKYGDSLLAKYASDKVRDGLNSGMLSRSEAVSLAIGNHMLCICPPWWDWCNVPGCYADTDAPKMMPSTIGTGSYESYFNKVHYIRENYDCYLLATIWGSQFEKAYFCRGIENFLRDLGCNHAFAKRLLGFIIRKNLVMLENIVAEPACDGILLGSDWGTQQSLLMSPMTWRHFIVPGEKKEYALIRKGGKDVWIHSCGNIEQIMPDLVELGIDGLNPIQPECMNIYQLKDYFGRYLCFWGGISTQKTLPYGTPDEVWAESTKVISHMRTHGGYVMAPAQEIQTDVPFENLVALIDAARSFA